MDAVTFLKAMIAEAIPYRIKSVSELAEKAGVSQPNLSEFLNGRRKSMNLETAWRILAVLGLEVRPKNTSQPPSPSLPSAVPADLEVLPVHAVAGAGPAWDDETVEPKFYIAVPAGYTSKNFSTLLIRGESMRPTILDNAVVGVNRDSKEIVQGQLYAVRLPYEGIVVKRMYINHAKKCFVLHSDNTSGEYPDIELPFEEGGAFIYGCVEWVLQSYKKLVV